MFDSLFIIGVSVGLLIALCIAAWVYIDLTPGDDHPLTSQEIRDRIGECFNCEGRH